MTQMRLYHLQMSIFYCCAQLCKGLASFWFMSKKFNSQGDFVALIARLVE